MICLLMVAAVPYRPHNVGHRNSIQETAMKRMLFAALLLPLGLVTLTGAPTKAFADGCYICRSGSSPGCRDYCRYRGKDTYANRKKCKVAGCKIGGTASCPTAVNYRICSAALKRRSPAKQYATARDTARWLGLD